MGRSVFVALFFLALVIVSRSDIRDDVTLRQVWDGGTLLQLLYSSSGEPLACESTKSPQLEGLVETANFTEARRDCRAANIRHLRIRRATRHGKHRKTKPKPKHKKAKDKDHLAKGKKASWKNALITPGTKWCGPSNSAGSYSDLGIQWEADRCCRNHDQCQQYILAMSKGYNNFNMSPFTLSHCSCDRRGDTELLRMPGTLWCGRGFSASRYGQLGPFLEADRCCRRHDTACPHYIAAMSHGYGLYNWRPSTLMHCSCDRRFRTCLKMSGTTTANIVGKLFFNLVQTKCFVLKPERICVERSWWGKCQKTEVRKLAHIKTNMAY